jgi:hypothetical protein
MQQKATALSQFLEIQPDNIKWIWEQQLFDVDIAEVAQWIRDGDAIAVSNDSFKIPMGHFILAHTEQTPKTNHSDMIKLCTRESGGSVII